MFDKITSSVQTHANELIHANESPISFSKPTNEDQFYRLYSQTTWLILAVGSLIVTVICILFIQSENWRFLYTTLISGTAILIAFPFQLAGNPKAAIYSIIFGCYLAAWDGVASTGGLHSIGIQALYPIFVVISIFTFSRLFQIFTLITIIILGALTYFQISGQITSIDPMQDEPFASAIIVCGLFLVTIIMLRYVARRTSILSQELALAQREAHEAKQEADQANQLKSIFLANMSHELRTPLNAIIGYGEGLVEDQDWAASDSGQLNEEATEDISRIVHSGKYLLSLINDIIDLSKIEAEEIDLHPEEFDLTQLIEEVVMTVEPMTIKNQNTLSIDIREKITIHTDRRKLAQVLLNLVSNAVKYTQYGNIHICLETDPSHNFVQVRVEDTGSGIDAEEIPFIFEPFHRTERIQKSSIQGTGLGLAITKRIADNLGCELGVDSEINVGSTFWVNIPVLTISMEDKIPEPTTAEHYNFV